MKEFIKEVLKHNGWLSGYYDYLDGDIMALLRGEEYFNSVVEFGDTLTLFENLKRFVGVFKYRELVFFNDPQYGCFVYREDNPENYIEHLSIDAMEFKDFNKLVNELLRKIHCS